MGILNDNSMFIKVETYKESLEVVDRIKAKIDEAKNSMKKVTELKKEEEIEMDLWRKMLGDVEAKVHRIDQTLVSAGKR
jgi:hypothetical protein